MNQDRVVLAALSSKDSVTIPSTTVGGKPPVMVAQVGEAVAAAGAGTIFGASVTTVIAVVAGAAAIGGIELQFQPQVEGVEEKKYLFAHNQ